MFIEVLAENSENYQLIATVTPCTSQMRANGKSSIESRKFYDPPKLLLANIEFMKWMSHYFEFCICAIELLHVAIWRRFMSI